MKGNKKNRALPEETFVGAGTGDLILLFFFFNLKTKKQFSNLHIIPSIMG